MTTKRMSPKTKDAKARLGDLAARLVAELGIETTEGRSEEPGDVRSVPVADLKRLLQRAFVLGMQVAQTERPDIRHFIDAL